ncbi:hypothetical protein ICN48_06570 [Polynucleobacter sp. JS-Safj-400b-B2]|uniref:hypothetical protein n=1 Tax=Polynucleobacter sp. JS-Safj-400b-B2 TaxID=2576921 RepID=UPI001C0BC617|nr:hypothetical protein [Polynucleobacter sp. JS-Safj-400b-B2]MBU3625897.1 hypothetical protein [Polynucleobacter sp. JS-Safj-400b-B2]
MQHKTIALCASLLFTGAAYAQGVSADSPLAALLAKRGQESSQKKADTSSQSASSVPASKNATQNSPPSVAPKVEEKTLAKQKNAASTHFAPALADNTKMEAAAPKTGATNPINGQDATVEDLDRVLSIKKKQTDIALEEAKRLKAEAEILTYNLKQGVPPKVGATDQKPAPQESAVISVNAKKKIKGKLEVAQIPPQSIGPNVVGVMTSKGEPTAMIEVAGQIMYLKQGESSGTYTVGSINQNTVEINGRSYSVGSQASRQTTVDRQVPTGPNGVPLAQSSNLPKVASGIGASSQSPLPPIQSITSTQPFTGVSTNQANQPITLNNAAGTSTAPPPPQLN